jgi:CRISPR/Cas system CSM-associated protein Csm3 (group 7 of RAMP superfamily)
VWGFQEGEEGFASFVFVEDAALSDDAARMVEVRDSVGIDREWGCAAEQIKYDRAVLPRGTCLPLQMTVEFEEGQRRHAVEMFHSLGEALASGDVRIGAAKSRGLGKLKLGNPSFNEHTLNTRHGILALLRGENGQPVSDLPAVLVRQKRPRLEIMVKWHPVGPLMVKAGADGIGVDSVPLVSGRDGQLTLVLPGSSVKGAIRNQAERIVRTLLGTPLSQEPNPRKRFLTHLSELPLIEAIFGAAGRQESTEDDTDATEEQPVADESFGRLGLSALAADDCYGEPQFSRDQWQAVISAATEAAPGERESELRTALNNARLARWTAAFHVAVDRWTGGAAESLLYNVLEPHAVAWEPLRFTVDLKRLNEAVGAAPDEFLSGLMLVLLALRDLAKGRVPLGFATNRGMGAIEVESVHFSGRDLSSECQELAALDLPGGDFAGIPQRTRDALQAAWKRWCESASAARETEVRT